MKFQLYHLSIFLISAIHLVKSFVSYTLPSLEDVDFDRIRQDQLQSSTNGGIVYPNATMDLQLSGSGYHRDLTARIRIHGGVPVDSRILLVTNITRDIYVDIDQVTINLRPFPVYTKL